MTFSISILYSVDNDSALISVKLGLESCSKGDRCPDAMVCQSGVCACEMGTMTDDRKFCLKSDEKLLGSYCTPSVDECFQLSGNYCTPSADRVFMNRKRKTVNHFHYHIHVEKSFKLIFYVKRLVIYFEITFNIVIQ